MSLISAQYNYISLSCNLQGDVTHSADQSIRVVCQDGVTPMAEQIIPLYEQYGYDCVKYLCGPVSFFLYDSNKQQLLVSRDRLGGQQIYYAQEKQTAL